MLQVFRDAAHKWFVKLLFWLLVLSFGLWGIGDVVYRFFADKPLATVGKRAISYEDFNRELQKQSARIQALANGKITPEQLKAIGVYKIALNRLVDEAAIQEELEELRLRISDETIKDAIHAQKAFRVDGKFSPERFFEVLRNQNMSEKDFVAEFRFDLLRRQFMASLAGGAELPGFYAATILDALTREFVFATVEVKADAVPVNLEVTDERLKSFYDQRRERYAIPEYRDISVIKLDHGALRGLLDITDERVIQAYASGKDKLRYPERRTLDHLAYSDKDKADKAYRMALAGADFETIKKEIPGEAAEEIKLVTEAELPEFAATKIFALGKGKHSEVIGDGTAYHIFFVREIERARTPDLAEAKGEIEKALIAEGKGAKLEEIRDKIDDGLAAGRKLSEIAGELNLKVTDIPSLTAEGKDNAGKPAIDEKDEFKEAIVQKAFATEQGLDSGLVNTSDDSAFILSVNKVSPSRVPDFEQVRDKVLEDYLKEKRLEAAAKIAETIAGEAKSLKTLMEAANRHNGEFSTNHAMTRLDVGKPNRSSFALIPPALAERAFSLAPDAAAVDRNDKGGFTVAMIQKIGDLKATKAEKASIEANLNGGIKEDVVALTTDGLRDEHAVEINQEMLARMSE